MNIKAKFILCLLSSAALLTVLYITFHELGHMIVMLSAGDTIDDFSIIGAHVSGHGGTYTNASDLWLHANGAVLPFVISLAYVLLYRKKSNNTFYRCFSFFAGLVPSCSLLAWIIIPFLYLKGAAPAGDDVTHFLDNFSQTAHPLVVSAAATLLIGIVVFLSAKKGVIENYFSEIKAMKA